MLENNLFSFKKCYLPNTPDTVGFSIRTFFRKKNTSEFRYQGGLMEVLRTTMPEIQICLLTLLSFLFQTAKYILKAIAMPCF